MTDSQPLFLCRLPFGRFGFDSLSMNHDIDRHALAPCFPLAPCGMMPESSVEAYFHFIAYVLLPPSPGPATFAPSAPRPSPTAASATAPPPPLPGTSSALVVITACLFFAIFAAAAWVFRKKYLPIIVARRSSSTLHRRANDPCPVSVSQYLSGCFSTKCTANSSLSDRIILLVCCVGCSSGSGAHSQYSSLNGGGGDDYFDAEDTSLEDSDEVTLEYQTDLRRHDDVWNDLSLGHYGAGPSSAPSPASASTKLPPSSSNSPVGGRPHLFGAGASHVGGKSGNFHISLGPFVAGGSQGPSPLPSPTRPIGATSTAFGSGGSGKLLAPPPPPPPSFANRVQQALLDTRSAAAASASVATQPYPPAPISARSLANATPFDGL